MNRDKAVDGIVDKQPIDIQKLIEATRDVIFEVVPDVQESVKWGQPCYSKEFDLAYIAPSKRYIKIGFFNSQKIENRDEELEGTGEKMRHYKIHSPEDIDRQKISNWLNAVANLK